MSVVAPTRTTMETFSGRWLDFDHVDPEDITLTDIARALSLTCRFGGHIPFFYSVAEHALLVRSLVIEDGHPELALAALHHDSHEAYLGDIPTPLKVAIGSAYREMVTEIDVAIAQKLGLDLADLHHPAVAAADELALRIEASHLKRSQGVIGAWPWRELPPSRDLLAMSPDAAARAFVHAHVGDWQPA